LRQEAEAVLQSQFRNVPVSISLAQPRQFYVHVTGAVPVPGRYPAQPVARVSSVLEYAFADTAQAPVTNLRYQPSFRNVILRQQDGTQRSLDLRQYFATGDTEHNPYLQDGDVIAVEAFDPTFESVFVDGAVAFPGRYDYREGDTVLDLLRLTAGGPGIRHIQSVRLTRQSSDGTVDDQILAVPALLKGTTPNPAVRPLDNLYVFPRSRTGGTATVEGYVAYPGTYPIEEGRTTLARLIQMAGGLREDALPRGAYLSRPVFDDIQPQVVVDPQRQGVTNPSAMFRIRTDSSAILRRIRLANLDYLSRVYFAQEVRMQNQVPVNLQAQMQGEVDPIMLRDGDRLVVPRDNNTIFVFGQVNQPGYFPYRPDRSIDAYVEAAGGLGALATGVFVVKAGTGEFLPPERATLASGDAIFVDRQDIADDPQLQRLLLEENRARADARIRSTQVLLQILTTAATVVTTYLFVRNN
jgi:protein involved in polysaccharide export with SLBB domain